MIDGVPEAGDLVKMGLAEDLTTYGGTNKTKRVNHIRLSPEGAALMSQKLREAGRRNGPMTGAQLREMVNRQKTQR